MTKEANVIQIDDRVIALNRLVEINQRRKELEKEEKELKAFFKKEIGPGELFETEDGIVKVSQGSRESLDRKGLEKEFGVQAIGEFVKKTDYLKVDVKAK